MKYSFFALALSLIIALPACKNRKPDQPQGKEEAGLPSELAKAYRDDAARLALREYNTTTRNEEPQVGLPKERTAYFFELLTKVYLMAEADPAIPSIGHIHTLESPPLQNAIVMLEKDASFKDEWLAGRRMTSNLYLNQVMSENNLRVSECREMASGTMCNITAAQPINVKDLCFILGKIDGIQYAEPDGIAGDGNDIVWGTEGKNHMALKFKIGQGDCPSGCIHNKYWIFYVQEDGTINYMGTRGELPGEEKPEEEED